MKKQEYGETSNKPITEPFTILLMGVDSERDGLAQNAAFNGDTLMLISLILKHYQQLPLVFKRYVCSYCL